MAHRELSEHVSEILRALPAQIAAARKKSEQDFAVMARLLRDAENQAQQQIVALESWIRKAVREGQAQALKSFLKLEPLVKNLGAHVALTDPRATQAQRNWAANFLAQRMGAYLANPRARKEAINRAGARRMNVRDMLQRFHFPANLLFAAEDAFKRQRIRLGSRGKTIKAKPSSLPIGDFARWLEAEAYAKTTDEFDTESPDDVRSTKHLTSDDNPEVQLLRHEETERARAVVSELKERTTQQEKWLIELALHGDDELVDILKRIGKSPAARRKFTQRLREKLLRITPPPKKKQRKPSR